MEQDKRMTGFQWVDSNRILVRQWVDSSPILERLRGMGQMVAGY